MENEKEPIYKRPVDEYLPCKEYKGDDGFIKFYKEDEKRYYFAYNGNNGITYLKSQGYTQEPGRDNGIDSVIRNAPLDERWSTKTSEDGKLFYYSLKAGNRQEIARSCYYESKEEMEAAFAWVHGEESTIGKGAKEIDGVWWSASALRKKQEEETAKLKDKEEVPRSNRNIDEYLPCEDYAGSEGFYKFFRDDKKEYYFAYNDDKQKTYLRSEGYTNEAGRDNGINSVIKNAPLDERWTTNTAMDKKYHYYALKAGNHQEIARSCYYEDKDAMLADLTWLRGENSLIGKGSKLVGGVLMSAAMLAASNIEAVPKPEPETYNEESKVEKSEPIVAAPLVNTSDKAGCGRWWPWLLLLAAIIILCLIFCRGCDDKISEPVTDASTKIENVTNDVTKDIAATTEKVTDKAGEVAGKAIKKVSEASTATGEVINKVLKPEDSFVLEGLHFVYNKDALTNYSKEILNKAVITLKKYSTLKVEIQGHTDDRGNDAYNKKLSQKRANAIMQYLVSKGISASRLTAVGYGERHPIATNSTDEGRAKNRRIEFKILEK